MGIWLRNVYAATAVLVATSTALAQDSAVEAQPTILTGIEFFQPVAFGQIVPIAAYQDNSGMIHLAPSGLLIPQESVTVLHKDGAAGVLSFNVVPQLSNEMTDSEVLERVSAQFPDQKIALISPRLVRLEINILSDRQTVTPFTTTVGVGQPIPVTVSVRDDVLAFLLSGRTTGVTIGGASLTFAIRGYEIGLDGQRAVAERRIVVSGHLAGGCASTPASYVDSRQGDIGCKVPITYTRSEIAEVQKILTERGLYTGNIDGVAGPLTRKALGLAQSQLNLLVDGSLNYLTVKAILAGQLPDSPTGATEFLPLAEVKSSATPP